MRSMLSIATVAVAFVLWQPAVSAGSLGAAGEGAQPLTRADCVRAAFLWDENANVCAWISGAEERVAAATADDSIRAISAQPLRRADCNDGLSWDENRNVCDWQEDLAELASEPSIPSGQPLTRTDCSEAALAWDNNANICDWRPEPLQQQLASDATITGAITLSQPLTRAGCENAGLSWDEGGNVCSWQSSENDEQLASDQNSGIADVISSGQPLTRADCDRAALSWNDSRNVCDAARAI
jgi:hypothetical protein